jgi:hypothetical protein
MNTLSARGYSVAQFWRKWRDKQPGNQGDLHSSVAVEAGKVRGPASDFALYRGT